MGTTSQSKFWSSDILTGSPTAPIQGKRNRWVDLQAAFDEKYSSAKNYYLNELDAVCTKRGTPSTPAERDKIDEQMKKVMDIWLDENTEKYGFQYSFEKA